MARFPKRRYARKPRRAPTRKPARVMRKRTYARKKRASAIRLKLKVDNANTTYDSIYNRITPFMKKMKSRYFVGAKNIYNNVAQKQILQTNAGYQAVAYFSAFTYADLASALNTIGAAPTLTTGSLQNTTRSYWETYTSLITISNSTNFFNTYELYHFKCKKDCNQNPAQLWAQGFNDETNQTATNYTQFYGALPLDSVLLTTFYYCKRIVEFTLPPGGIHQQRWSIQKHCPLNNEAMNTASTDTNFAHWTEYILVVAKGCPMSSTTSGVDNGNTTSSLVQTNCLQTERYNWKYIADYDTNYKYSNASLGLTGNVFNIGSGGSVANVVV